LSATALDAHETDLKARRTSGDLYYVSREKKVLLFKGKKRKLAVAGFGEMRCR